MTLSLTSVQRGMLAEMGVQVWLPAEAGGLLPDAVRVDCPRQGRETVAPARPMPPRQPVAIQERPAARFAAAPRNAENAGPDAEASSRALSRVAQLFQPPEPAGAAHAAAWLIVSESLGASLARSTAAHHRAAMRLLENMLRAARWPVRGGAHLYQLHPAAPHGEASSGSAALPSQSWQDVLAELRPAVVLLMGRAPAQYFLRNQAPLGQLRGQIHRVGTTALVATYDIPYLLRAPAEKARAWEDLCLAIQAAMQDASVHP